MSRRDELDWHLTDEELPDLFDLVDNPSPQPAPGLKSSADRAGQSEFAQDLAQDIALMLTDEFSIIQRPPSELASDERKSIQRAQRSESLSSMGLRKIPSGRAPQRRGPPPVPGSSTKSGLADREPPTEHFDRAAMCGAPAPEGLSTQSGQSASQLRSGPQEPVVPSEVPEELAVEGSADTFTEGFRIHQSAEEMFALEKPSEERTQVIEFSYFEDDKP